MLIKNARIVTRDEEFIGVVRIDGEHIVEVAPGGTAARDAQDWDGDYLLPGLVELHTDNIEKHLAPRPGVLWNTDSAILVHDAQVVAAGITTVFDALAIGSPVSNSLRGRDQQMRCARSIASFAARGLLRAEHFLHLRCEIATPDVVEVFDSLGAHPLLRLASVMDHTPGQRQWQDPVKWRRYQERNGKLTDAQMQATLAELDEDHRRYAVAHRREIVERCAARGLTLASHDDTLVEHVDEAAADGMVLSEFPTTLAAAQAARDRGIATIMGAPNIVRDASHSGNVSALALAQQGLLDILSSDYVPSSLMAAAFELVRQADWTLPSAIASVSAMPAMAAGLTDRGHIAPGMRADLVRVVVADTLPVSRATYRAGTRVA
jgi:alpha-D-ribose 1-methylphosphonate 5-triphosphate diphosphatase